MKETTTKNKRGTNINADFFKLKKNCTEIHGKILIIFIYITYLQDLRSNY